ncbi:SusC/RagA family TonB-linked outer membrane protein [Chitinophaga parva]|uniref:SusC/RagA family TonB-linked outer membrane protein n=1 Tax=Chitinophaga parva TaxID=2169414 RepID=A0A2T7BGX2_9BACT|nr:SusC/RagA family TonB-linked outer membrane protein [Chitinophaga parva]PUZ25522.1 SusC/RagA family TonB-linked outer membrane protein [Chitinophaga parva]
MNMIFASHRPRAGAALLPCQHERTGKQRHPGTVMKLFVLLAFVLQGWAPQVHAQTITYAAKDASLRTIFNEVRKQTGYGVFGNENLLKDTKPVSIQASNMALADFLNRIMEGQPINYRVDGKNIIFFSRNRATADAALARGMNVNGNVLSEDGLPIPGATCMIKGTRRGAMTNEHGNVTLENVTPPFTVVITSIGFETEEINVTAYQLQFSSTMRKKALELGHVDIRTGMFTRRKEDFTGAASVFTGDQLKSIGNRNILESLKTLDPSFVQVTNNAQGANPNAMPIFEIRGRTSVSNTDLNSQFSADPNQPLFILDGFESTLQAIYDLDMNRVASVTILKDAASTALYGAKASNGVVVVETKRPVPGQLRISYTADLSLDMPDLRSYNMMNAAEKLEFERLSQVYYKPTDQWNTDQRYASRMAAVQSGINTYWLSEPVQLGLSNRHSVQLNGGNSDLMFNAGASYGMQNGVMKGSSRSAWSGNFNLTYRKNAINVTNQMNVTGGNAVASPYGNFSDFVNASPYYRKRLNDGSIPKYLDTTGLTLVNPLYNASLYSINKSPNFNFYDNLAAIYTISRTLRVQGGIQLARGTQDQVLFVPPDNTQFDGADPTQKGSYTSNHTATTSYSMNLMLTWAKVVGRHRFNANGRTEMQQNRSEMASFSAVGFPYGTNGNPSYAFQYTPFSRPNALTVVSRSVGFLGSVNYVFDDRFMVDATYRLDGASVFGSNRLFKPFASGGIGWNLHREQFLRQVKWINLLKIRGDIGITGNENLGQFTSTSTFSFQQGQNNFGQGLNMVSLGNPDLEWQKTRQESYGVDFGFLGSRISGTVDYFRKLTDPMAIGTSGTLPSSTGVNANYVINLGHLTTTGWEFNVRFSPIYNLKKQIVWTIGITGSAYKSTYGGLGNQLELLNKKSDSLSNRGGTAALNSLNRYADGYSPDDIWAVRSRGIDPATGNELFQAKDGTLTFDYNPSDVVRVGNTRPAMQGVINTSFNYKQFIFGAAIRYSMGGYQLNSALYTKVENIGNLLNNQDKRALYDRWKNPGDISQFKSITSTGSTPMSSRFVEKDNYFDGESFNLGYRVGQGWIRKLKMQSLSLNFYLNNIFWIESIKTERGTSYPFDRTASFSLNASF